MRHLIIKLILVAATVFVPWAVRAQGTTFTYQGRFNTNHTPYTGPAEFQFTLWDAASEMLVSGGAGGTLFADTFSHVPSRVMYLYQRQ